MPLSGTVHSMPALTIPRPTSGMDWPTSGASIAWKRDGGHTFAARQTLHHPRERRSMASFAPWRQLNLPLPRQASGGSGWLSQVTPPRPGTANQSCRPTPLHSVIPGRPSRSRAIMSGTRVAQRVHSTPGQFVAANDCHAAAATTTESLMPVPQRDVRHPAVQSAAGQRVVVGKR